MLIDHLELDAYRSRLLSDFYNAQLQRLG